MWVGQPVIFPRQVHKLDTLVGIEVIDTARGLHGQRQWADQTDIMTIGRKDNQLRVEPIRAAGESWSQVIILQPTPMTHVGWPTRDILLLCVAA